MLKCGIGVCSTPRVHWRYIHAVVAGLVAAGSAWPPRVDDAWATSFLVVILAYGVARALPKAKCTFSVGHLSARGCFIKAQVCPTRFVARDASLLGRRWVLEMVQGTGPAMYMLALAMFACWHM